jgi:hypothetical protein
MAGGVRSRKVLMVMVLKVTLEISIKVFMRVIRVMEIILEEGTMPIIVIAGPIETLISLGIGTISVPAVGLIASGCCGGDLVFGCCYDSEFCVDR